MPNQDYPSYREDAQHCDLAPILKIWAKVKKNPEIKQPLAWPQFLAKPKECRRFAKQIMFWNKKSKVKVLEKIWPFQNIGSLIRPR